jgi:hypothetical protein
MKVLLIILGVLLVIAGAVQFLSMRSQKNIESYPYEVVKSYDGFEIRKYEASLFTSIKLNSTNYEQSSGSGFSILAGYIFGNNDRQEKIAMTSPVAMSLEDTMSMMFMVPKKWTKESLPKPNQSNIEIIQEPAKLVAAIPFGGWANDEKINRYKSKLITALDAASIKYTNRYFYLGYNPPYDVVNRRNEIIVELESGDLSP